jgi:hypothetical protein
LPKPDRTPPVTMIYLVGIMLKPGKQEFLFRVGGSSPFSQHKSFTQA